MGDGSSLVEVGVPDSGFMAYRRWKTVGEPSLGFLEGQHGKIVMSQPSATKSI